MKSLFVERRHLQVLFDVAVFHLPSLVTGPSFMFIITGSGVMTVFL